MFRSRRVEIVPKAKLVMVSHNQIRECRDCGTTTDVHGYEDPRLTEAFGDSQWPDVYLCPPCRDKINDGRRDECNEMAQRTGSLTGVGESVDGAVERPDVGSGQHPGSGDGAEDRHG